MTWNKMRPAAIKAAPVRHPAAAHMTAATMSATTTAVAAATAAMSINGDREKQKTDGAQPHDHAAGCVKMIQDFRHCHSRKRSVLRRGDHYWRPFWLVDGSRCTEPAISTSNRPRRAALAYFHYSWFWVLITNREINFSQDAATCCRIGGVRRVFRHARAAAVVTA